VGEWLKPADCKSAPPSEVRRFESFPVHHIVVESGVNRFLLAMVTYAALAALAIATLSDQRIRMVTLAVLAMFALKTWVRRKDVMHPDGESGSEQKPM
jgi:hypothetical protein